MAFFISPVVYILYTSQIDVYFMYTPILHQYVFKHQHFAQSTFDVYIKYTSRHWCISGVYKLYTKLRFILVREILLG